MKFKIGDKVKMKDDLKAAGRGVLGKVGEVVRIDDDGTSLERITVEFPDVEPLVGMNAGQFEIDDGAE
jgi:hypothetical protein